MTQTVRRHALRAALYTVLCALICLATMACGAPQEQVVAAKHEPADARVKALADGYLSGFFDRNPDQATYFGVPGRHHDQLPDNSLAAQKAWEGKEDAWLKDARAIDPADIQTGPLKATYAITREALESSVSSRVCRSELWNVSQMTGWHISFGYLVTIQPLGSEDARKEALARWSVLPRYIDTEIANLREGIRLKYTAPKLNVRIVIDQLNSLISDTAESPFLSPTERDKDPAFDKVYQELFQSRLLEAFKKYRDFLQNEYLPAAREDIAVAANPDGAACYAASVRAFSTLPVQARTVHETGEHEVEKLMGEMQEIAIRSFHTSDVPALLQKLRSDRQFMFKDRDDLIRYSQAALARAKTAVPDWFGLVPKADVRIEPYPKFREKNGSSEYNPPAEDGSRSALFYINAYEAEKKSRAPAESTAFHETIPGHHLQGAIAIERKDIHPIGRYIANSGFVEGWALYAERLADEMKLYSSDLDRIGMLSEQNFRASRLVVDTGIHTMGWTRQQAIDYMLGHTAESADDIAAEVDRYIIWPGQATAYMLGMLEIRDAREEAQHEMGAKFDIKAFHDRVLEDGAVPITFLSSKIKSWAMIH
ncbi:MAG TPA: DUF885 domain-containing protein [Vicinamibacterales bacterium]